MRLLRSAAAPNLLSMACGTFFKLLDRPCRRKVFDLTQKAFLEKIFVRNRMK
jgi:hypothetical protein